MCFVFLPLSYHLVKYHILRGLIIHFLIPINYELSATT